MVKVFGIDPGADEDEEDEEENAILALLAQQDRAGHVHVPTFRTCKASQILNAADLDAVDSNCTAGNMLTHAMVMANGGPTVGNLVPRNGTDWIDDPQLLNGVVSLLHSLDVLSTITPPGSGQCIAHLDIKGPNIVCGSRGRGADWRLIDWGLSQLLPASPTTRRALVMLNTARVAYLYPTEFWMLSTFELLDGHASGMRVTDTHANIMRDRRNILGLKPYMSATTAGGKATLQYHGVMDDDMDGAMATLTQANRIRFATDAGTRKGMLPEWPAIIRGVDMYMLARMAVTKLSSRVPSDMMVEAWTAEIARRQTVAAHGGTPVPRMPFAPAWLSAMVSGFIAKRPAAPREALRSALVFDGRRWSISGFVGSIPLEPELQARIDAFARRDPSHFMRRVRPRKRARAAGRGARAAAGSRGRRSMDMLRSPKPEAPKRARGGRGEAKARELKRARTPGYGSGSGAGAGAGAAAAPAPPPAPAPAGAGPGAGAGAAAAPAPPPAAAGAGAGAGAGAATALGVRSEPIDLDVSKLDPGFLWAESSGSDSDSDTDMDIDGDSAPPAPSDENDMEKRAGCQIM